MKCLQSGRPTSSNRRGGPTHTREGRRRNRPWSHAFDPRRSFPSATYLRPGTLKRGQFKIGVIVQRKRPKMCILITILSLSFCIYASASVYIYISKTWVYLHNNEGKSMQRKNDHHEDCDTDKKKSQLFISLYCQCRLSCITQPMVYNTIACPIYSNGATISATPRHQCRSDYLL